MCFDGPKWKREVVPDHKFDFIDTREFHAKTISIRFRYAWLYVIVIKSFLVYLSDIFTAVTMLSSEQWSNSIFESCPEKEDSGCVYIPFVVAKWLFTGCILFSIVLLAYEARKSKRIIASRDISYAFTNVMANNYYSLRSYDHFCFFCSISDSTTSIDKFAFFIFFTFKEWKRLLLADGPRQTINGLTLYAIYLSKRNNKGDWYDIRKYSGGELVTTGLLISTLFTVLIFIGSMLTLVAAAICYVPLLFYIRGNLKEYCCHKVDKRISEVVKRKTKERLQKNAALARKEAAGDFSHLRNKKGEFMANPLPQPTLPNISLDDDETMYKGGGGGGNDYWKPDHKSDYQQSVYSNGGPPDYGGEYPPMPMYPYQNQGAYASFGPSVPTLHDGTGSIYDGSEYEYANLAQSAAPVARTGTPQQSQNYLQNPHSPAQGGAGARVTSGLAYDEEPAPLPPAPGRTPSRNQYETPGRTPSRNQYGQPMARQSPDQSRQYYQGGYGGY